MQEQSQRIRPIYLVVHRCFFLRSSVSMVDWGGLLWMENMFSGTIGTLHKLHVLLCVRRPNPTVTWWNYNVTKAEFSESRCSRARN